MTTAIVIGASSDIGAAMCHRWQEKGWRVAGTYRKPSPTVRALRKAGLRIIQCNLASARASGWLINLGAVVGPWDVLALATGILDPIGPFEEIGQGSRWHFNGAWNRSILVNLTGPLMALHSLLPFRSPDAAVVTFAGAGTNGPAPNYSAYAVSKVALIKAMELLDAEMPDTRFISIGPGWVRTRIHDQTLKAGDLAGANRQRTEAMLGGHEGWTPMERVLDCVDWALTQPREVIGGRNISVAGDPWEHPAFPDRLRSAPDLNKLRRLG